MKTVDARARACRWANEWVLYMLMEGQIPLKRRGGLDLGGFVTAEYEWECGCLEVVQDAGQLIGCEGAQKFHHNHQGIRAQEIFLSPEYTPKV